MRTLGRIAWEACKSLYWANRLQRGDPRKMENQNVGPFLFFIFFVVAFLVAMTGNPAVGFWIFVAGLALGIALTPPFPQDPRDQYR